ncbi:MAG: hypothetical protein EOO43_20005 [Flavobacterium sp.]|nr:MAG: hypothetical protein EOO43_20005 [Flavobacterium sp.]
MTIFDGDYFDQKYSSVYIELDLDKEASIIQSNGYKFLENVSFAKIFSFRTLRSKKNYTLRFYYGESYSDQYDVGRFIFEPYIIMVQQ